MKIISERIRMSLVLSFETYLFIKKNPKEENTNIIPETTKNNKSDSLSDFTFGIKYITKGMMMIVTYLIISSIKRTITS